MTVSTGTTYSGRDLCERVGTDAPGPTPAPGADTSFDGVGATLLTGAWQHTAPPLTGVPGFLSLGGAAVTDQHRANSYFAFNQLECPGLLSQVTEAVISADAAWNAPVLTLPGTTGAMEQFSLNQVFGALAPTATAHLGPAGANTGLGGVALMSQGQLCQVLVNGLDLGGGTSIANGFPVSCRSRQAWPRAGVAPRHPRVLTDALCRPRGPSERLLACLSPPPAFALRPPSCRAV